MVGGSTHAVRPGMVLVHLCDGDTPPRSVYTFDAQVSALHHPTGFRVKCECVVHLHSIRQGAVVVAVHNSEQVLRSGETGRLTLMLLQRPELVSLNMPVMICDGAKIRGMGQVVALGPD
eukprot:GDKI01023623.1.p1 GENE.GDKI01023623.1~~GDKI01023623.1.p1  ORF type:complete len:119 (+),score=22.16 GDKI01023623.1:2-358(+)